MRSEEDSILLFLHSRYANCASDNSVSVAQGPATVTYLSKIAMDRSSICTSADMIASAESMDSDLALRHDSSHTPMARLLDLLCEKIGNSWKSLLLPSL